MNTTGTMTRRSSVWVALFAAAGLAMAGAAQAQTQTMSKDAHDAAVKAASAQYKTDKAACDALSGNAEDVCEEEAKGKEKVAKAEAEAAYRNTPKAREDLRLARAQATYEVAEEKCDDLAGNTKDVCVKEAKAALAKAKADAKVDRVAATTSNAGAEKRADARREATEDKRDAEYAVAKERCDALAGETKDACIKSAKTRYGKT